MLIRSVSGVRFTLGDENSPLIILKYVESFANWLKGESIVIGYDARPSGNWIRHCVIGALAANGISVIDIGIAPTPTIQLAVKELKASGGISISASHNPEEWNGFKFLSKDGICLTQSENNELYSIVDSDSKPYPKKYSDFEISSVDFDNSSLFQLPLVVKSNLFSKLNTRKFHCVVDAVNASGSFRIPKFLEKIGCTVVRLYCDGTGNFPHLPEPLPQNLTELAKQTKFNIADIGIAVDPDADRLVLIDENGTSIGEEKTIALATEAVFYFKNKYQLFENYANCVTVNLSTSKMVEDVAKKHSATIFRSSVGEVNVIEEMKRSSSVIGGEGSGGVILPDSHYGRDSFVGILLILGLMVETNKTLSELSNELPKYSMVKMKKTFQGDFSEIVNVLNEKYINNEIDTRDGIKIYFENSWVHIRASNTEPIARCIAEAPTNVEAERLATTFLKFIP